MTNRESLVAALEEANLPTADADHAMTTAFYAASSGSVFDVRRHITRLAVATDADLLLPLLLAHASPEARAAALRGLLGEREQALMKLGEAMVPWWDDDLPDGEQVAAYERVKAALAKCRAELTEEGGEDGHG